MSYNLTFLENATAVDIVNGVQSNIPNFIPLILVFEWFIISLAGTYANQRKTGYTNFYQWGALASIVTLTSGYFLNLILDSTNQVVFLSTMIILLIVTILFAIMALLYPQNEL